MIYVPRCTIVQCTSTYTWLCHEYGRYGHNYCIGIQNYVWNAIILSIACYFIPNSVLNGILIERDLITGYRSQLSKFPVCGIPITDSGKVSTVCTWLHKCTVHNCTYITLIRCHFQKFIPTLISFIRVHAGSPRIFYERSAREIVYEVRRVCDRISEYESLS